MDKPTKVVVKVDHKTILDTKVKNIEGYTSIQRIEYNFYTRGVDSKLHLKVRSNLDGIDLDRLLSMIINHAIPDNYNKVIVEILSDSLFPPIRTKVLNLEMDSYGIISKLKYKPLKKVG